MYPYGRSLVKKFEGKPFAIVGVNTDSNRERVKDVIAKEKLTWRSFWDGGSPEGPIALRWNVTAYPTIYLIDHKGMIIQRIGWYKEADDVIEQKVKEAEAELKSRKADSK